jgi:glycosyltransferase involved in cell wall biosynthesis
MSAAPLQIGLFLKTFLGWQGGREYARNLLLSLRAWEQEREPGAFKIHLLAPASLSEASVEEFQPLADAVERLPTDLKRRPQAFFKELDARRIDFAFPLHNPTLGRVRTADCIFDFQHRHLAHLFPDQENRDRDRSFTRILKYSEKVVVSSQTSRQDLNTFFPGFDPLVRVLPFSTFPRAEWMAGDPRAVLERYGLPPRFFHVSNQFWMHKNHLTVFRALKLLADRGVEPVLVCTGSLVDYRTASYLDELLGYLHQNGLYPRVKLMGLMPRLDQLQVMRCALGVIQPSLFEGWSTVLEDARAFGKPTISSSLPVHLEQDLPRARYFAPEDAEALAALMAEAWNSDGPGHEPGIEAQAFAAARERSLKFASDFLAIAREPASAPVPHRLERRARAAWENLRSPFRR